MNRCAFILIVALLTSSLCPAEDLDQLRERYQAAIQDAKIAESNEIVTTLTAITDGNPTLIWKEDQGEKKILVVTWTSWEGYDPLVGKTVNVNSLPPTFSVSGSLFQPRKPYSVTRDIWVTVVPALQTFLRDHAVSPPDAALRVEQLLGLPPQNGKTRFVEFWVSPADLIRPSADPEITDTTTQLDFPPNCPAWYIQWYQYQKDNMYDVWGYPWTRLGYTYDWGNPHSEVGLSEFVIPQREENLILVDVHAVRLNQDYWHLASAVPGWELY